jgi:diaminohydroxyphosphoribosylaminopyrimidine deaminase/5-amino-6-(5-phosphoribosylamino)uracil reductase
MPAHSNDEYFLRRALDLARTGIALASPNPCVGAVIVARDGTVAGEGFHTYANKKHAEILALEQARERARDATLYVNLEPCSHQGRTGPCADAVIAAEIRRVVCCLEDPNPLVASKGFAKLRAAGISLEVGGFAAEARKLNEAFAKYIRHKTPFVTLKCAMTLDGRIAPHSAPGASSKGNTRTDWITGEAARAHVQQLRHQSDAILIGIGTVLADDPLLTDRTGLPRRRPLLRVLLDSHLRLPLEARVAQSSREDVLVLCASPEASKKLALEKLGVRVEQIQFTSASDREGRLDLSCILKRLGELEITSVLLEGGSRVNADALSSGTVDKVFLYIAPKLFGGTAIPFAAGLQNTIEFGSLQLHHFGKDFAVEGYLRDPYSS